MSAMTASLRPGRAGHCPERGSLPSSQGSPSASTTSTSTRLRGGRAAVVDSRRLTLDERIVGVWEGLPRAGAGGGAGGGVRGGGGVVGPAPRDRVAPGGRALLQLPRSAELSAAGTGPPP